MRKVRFSDWQEMALKKDIEDIKKKMNSQEPIFVSLCWEIMVALATIIIDHLFDIAHSPKWVWGIVIFIAVIPPTIALAHFIVPWIYSICRVKKGNLKIRIYVDMFDNQISYWVMLSNSYADMLTEALNDGHSTNAEKEFLYREGCYYNNKSMQALYSMKSNFDKIFSYDIELIRQKNLIDLARLQNLLRVMNEQQVQLDRDIAGVLTNGTLLQKNMNEKYLDELKDFLTDVNRTFASLVYNWDSNLNLPALKNYQNSDG